MPEERMKWMTKKKRKKDDPYAGIRREIPPPDFPMETNKYNRKGFKENTEEFIKKGVEEYYEGEILGDIVSSSNLIKNKEEENE